MKLFLYISLFVLYSQIGLATECPLGQYFVNSHFRSSFYKSDGTFVNSANIESHCRPYRFNKPLRPLFKNKIPERWPYQLEIFKKWSKLEKKEIEEVVTNLPKSLLELGEIFIYRSVKSSFSNNPSTSGPDESIIVLYDSAKKYGYRKVLVHELSHILWSRLSSEEQNEYFNSAEWDSKKKTYKNSRKVFSELDG